MELKEFLNKYSFKSVEISGHKYYRATDKESDPAYHDSASIDIFREKQEKQEKEKCEGCRGCIYSTCEVVHLFLTYLIDELEWSDNQLTKYFDLSYVNLSRHRSEYPGGCHVKLTDGEIPCDFHKMFVGGVDKMTGYLP